MDPSVANIHRAVEETEKCRATHLQSVQVMERDKDDIVCDGVVEVFDLHDHPTATRAYAWQRIPQKEGDDVQYIVVLKIPPVNSANDAVKTKLKLKS
jgi:hypothetical protein